MENKTVDVAIWMVAYNHEKYVSQAIESILMQETEYNYKIFIGEDCSKDDTRAICLSYAEQFPDKIELILHSANVGNVKNAFAVYEACVNSGARYMSLLEADDYWTTPHKLQRQAYFLDMNPAYSLITGGFVDRIESTGLESANLKTLESESINVNGFEITLDRFLNQWLTKSLTSMIRISAFNIGFVHEYKYASDVHLNYQLLKKGKGFYMSEILGTYRIHGGGVFSSLGHQQRLLGYYKVYRELYEHHPDDFRQKYIQVLLRLLRTAPESDTKFPTRRSLLWELFKIKKTREELNRACKLAGVSNPILFSLIRRASFIMGKVK